jgi:hypothetical protein
MWRWRTSCIFFGACSSTDTQLFVDFDFFINIYSNAYAYSDTESNILASTSASSAYECEYERSLWCRGKWDNLLGVDVWTVL